MPERPDPETLVGELETEEEKARRALEESRRRQTLSDLRSINEALTRKAAMLEDQVDLLLAVKDTPPKPVTVRVPKGKAKNPAVPVVCASDWHVEEVVEPAKVNWLNESNLTIAEERLHNFWANTVKLVEETQFRCDVKTAILWLGGDLYSGHIHEELPEVTELSPTESVLWLRDRITGGIRHLLDKTDVSEWLIPTSFGNHGRTTKRRRVSTSARHSYEWMLYKILESDFASEKRVRFEVATGYHNIVNVDGFMVRFHHGDELNYYGGVGGLNVPLRKAADSWNDGHPPPFGNIYPVTKVHLDVIGHWHQLLNYGYAAVNGSLIGYSPYAIKIKARYEPPSQAFFRIYTDRKRAGGFTPIFLT